MRSSLARSVLEALESRRLLSAGELDTTFDGDGRVLLSSGLGGGFTDVAVQSDGKIVAVGQLSSGGTCAVFRYNSNGTPDTTFGGGSGAAILPWNVSSDQFEIALLPNNAVVVVGASNGSVLVARFTSSGAPDIGFKGTGFLTEQLTGAGGSSVAQLGVQPDGKILVAVDSGSQAPSPGLHVKRYNTNGGADATFGPQGVRFVPMVDGIGQITDMAVRNGKILLAASDPSNDLFLARLMMADGAFDPSFDLDGTARSVLDDARGLSLGILHDDSFYLAGAKYAPGSTFTRNPLLARFTAAGAPDTSFGDFGDGTVIDTTLGDVSFEDLVVQSDNRPIVVTGSVGDFVIQRYLQNGDPDPGFGTSGRAAANVSGWDHASDVALAPDGKIVVAGYINDITGGGITRHLNDVGAITGSTYNDFDGNGSKDPTFEGAVSPVTVYLDLDNDGALDRGEPMTESNANGVFSFRSVSAGNYYVRQIARPDWVETQPAPGAAHFVPLDVGMPAFVEFGSRYTLSTLYGVVFSDANGNGVQDVTEPNTPNVRVYIDQNSNSAFDAGETFVFTGQTGAGLGGSYQFNLPPGSYLVRVEVPSGWTQTFPTPFPDHFVTLSAQSLSGPHNFGLSYPFAAVEGFVFNDVDGDGVWDSGEPGVGGRKVYSDLNNDGILNLGPDGQSLEPAWTTSSSGHYDLPGLVAGQHRIRVDLPKGHITTKPATNGGALVVNLAQGQHTSGLDFGSVLTGTAGGFIFDDDGDGVQEAGEFARTDFGVSAYVDLNRNGVYEATEPTSYTGGTGRFNFVNLVPGTYIVRLRDLELAGVRQTSPAGNGSPITFTVTGGEHTDVGPFGVQDTFSVIGFAFNDANANGVRDTGESNFVSRTIYADINDNGALDTGEPFGVTNGGGQYLLRLGAGSYRLRQVLPAGYEQTGRSAVNSPTSSFAATGMVVVPTETSPPPAPAGPPTPQFNFGSRLVPLTKVYGYVVRDTNGNGVTDSGEPGNTPGDVVYVDANNSGSFDSGESSFTTGTSGWSFNLPAGTYRIRQQLPAGWVQTMPAGSAPLTVTVPAGAASPDTLAGFFGRYQPPPQLPFKGSPFAFGTSTPVTIQAEDYDLGGEGIAYHDTTTGNVGGVYRSENVDIKLISGTSNQYRLSDAAVGEWVEYTIDAQQGGNYDLELRLSNADPNAKVHVEIDGVNVTGALAVPDTNNFSTFQSVKKGGIAIGQGVHILRLAFDVAASTGSVAGVDWLKLSATPVTPPPPPPGDTTTLTNTIAAYVRDGASATQNFGNDAQLIVKLSNTTGNKREGYLKFDVSTLPSDPAAITNVKLRLNGKLTTSGMGVNVAAFGASNTTWGETAITWNTKPATSGSALASKTISGTAAAWYEWDITSYVKTARQNGQQFVTLVLRATNTTDPQAVFNSDDAASNGPQLVATTSGGTSTPTQALVVSHAESGAGVPENGFEPVSVALAIAPTSNVTVTITKQGGGDADITADKTTLTFTPANWNVPQLVNLSGANDADTTNGQAIFSFASSGLPTVNVIATEQDDDQPTPPTGGTITTGTATYVRGGTSAGQNFGTASDLIVKKANSADSTREVYLKFDLSNVSAINTAKLRLNARLSDTSNASLVTQVFSATDTSWTESGLTWNNKPTAGTTVRGSFTVTGTTAQWYEIDLTSFLKAELAAGRKVVTLVLKNTTASNAQTVIGSDETANGPQLLIA